MNVLFHLLESLHVPDVGCTRMDECTTDSNMLLRLVANLDLQNRTTISLDVHHKHPWSLEVSPQKVECAFDHLHTADATTRS